MASETAEEPPQQKPARRDDHPRVIAKRVEPSKVAARGRRGQQRAVGGAGGQAQSGPCDRCGRTVLLSHVSIFAFSVIATLPTSTRPQTSEDTNEDCHL